jgi:hypothetical protein
VITKVLSELNDIGFKPSRVPGLQNDYIRFDPRQGGVEVQQKEKIVYGEEEGSKETADSGEEEPVPFDFVIRRGRNNRNYLNCFKLLTKKKRKAEDDIF